MQWISGGDLSISELDLSKCSFGRLESLFIFGLIYAEFGGLLPPVEDLYQNVLCFATKVAT